MRFGFLFCSRTTLAKVAALAAIAVTPLVAAAQPYGDYSTAGNRPATAQGQATQALYAASNAPSSGERQAMAFDSYGNPAIVPAGYCNQCGCDGQCGCYDGCGNGCYGGCGGGCYNGGYGGGCPGPGCQGGFNSCMPMGCGGTDPPVGYDLMNDAGMEGNVADQRGPHYFDVRAEAVWLRRDKSFGDNVQMTSENVGNVVVLNTNDLDIQDQVGFRIIGRYDICPLSVVEFGYTGIFDYSDSATVNDPTGNLYSLFSRPAPGTGLFGTSPAGVSVPGGPLPFTERAIQQSISLKSDLQSAEISYRRYWLGWSPRISGTLLAGFRYTKVDEDFNFSTLGTPNVDPTFTNPAFRYNTDAVNNLAGFQAGGDMWVGIFQGCRIGAEGKAGIYDNHYDLHTTIADGNAGALQNFLTERFRDDKAAFLTEGSVDFVADILPSLSLRAGYEVLFMDSLVLAGENFNQTSPYGNQGTRVPFVKDDGQLFYHGAHAGIEYTW